MLHLQSANQTAVGMNSASFQDPTTPNDSGSLVFERVVGSLGASLSLTEYMTTAGSQEDDNAMEQQVTLAAPVEVEEA